MAVKQIQFGDLKLDEKVTLRVSTSRYSNDESVIHGTVVKLPTAGGGAKVKLLNNKNSVTIYEDTNFRIFADRGPTVGDVLTSLPIGAQFDFKNKYGVTKRWVKTGADRVTLVNDDRPAHSLSISAGFPSAEEDNGRTTRRY